MDKVYKAIIVDDHPMVLEGLKAMLSNLEFVSIVACFKNGNSIFGYSDLSSVDIVFLDIFLSDSNGIDLCLKLKKLYPKIIILAMSSQSERSIVLQMIKNGVNGYLLKTASVEEFKNCTLNAIKGKLTFCNEVSELVTQVSITDLQSTPRLTGREKEIVTLLKQGRSTQEISEVLFLSHLTVQTHRRNLLAKFNVKNVIELLNRIDENKLL